MTPRTDARRRTPPKPASHSLHPYIQTLRDAALLTPGGYGAVGDLAGYDAHQVTHWMNGQTRMTVAQFIDVAQALGYDVLLVKPGEGGA